MSFSLSSKRLFNLFAQSNAKMLLSDKTSGKGLPEFLLIKTRNEPLALPASYSLNLEPILTDLSDVAAGEGTRYVLEQRASKQIPIKNFILNDFGQVIKAANRDEVQSMIDLGLLGAKAVIIHEF